MKDTNPMGCVTSARARNRRVFETVIRYVTGHKTSLLDEKIHQLEVAKPRGLRPWDDDEFLYEIAEVTAYQAVRAATVDKMDPTALREAFADFKVHAVAKLNPAAVERDHWDRIRCIRFKHKIARIIDSAKVIQTIQDEFGDFGAYLGSFHIPPRIAKDRDIEAFWTGAEALCADLRRRGMPSLGNWPSLLHFLMDPMRYDCSKPDVVAMRVGCATGIIQRPVGEHSQRLLAMAIQHYSLASGLRPVVVDTYLMCFGNQSAFSSYTMDGFSSCGSKERCTNLNCPVGAKGLCRIRSEAHCGY